METVTALVATGAAFAASYLIGRSLTTSLLLVMVGGLCSGLWTFGPSGFLSHNEIHPQSKPRRDPKLPAICSHVSSLTQSSHFAGYIVQDGRRDPLSFQPPTRLDSLLCSHRSHGPSSLPGGASALDWLHSPCPAPHSSCL